MLKSLKNIKKMMKKLLCIILLTFTIGGSSMAQNDSTSTQGESNKFTTEFSVATRNMFRGTGWGQSPSAMMNLVWNTCPYFSLGAYGNVTTNGTKEGYGNEFNYYATFNMFAENKNRHLKAISITVDDFFYFNSNDADNNYFDYSGDKTQHFIEGRVKYDRRFDLTGAYTLYANENANVDGVYIEAGYNITEDFYAYVGYVTDENALMFQSESGICNIGVTHQRKLNIKDFAPILRTSVIANPNYESIYNLPGVGRNPIMLVASITF